MALLSAQEEWMKWQKKKENKSDQLYMEQETAWYKLLFAGPADFKKNTQRMSWPEWNVEHAL